MERISISQIKAAFASVSARICKTILRTPLREPAADDAPPLAYKKPKRWVGSLAGTGQITGDIVSPASEDEDEDKD